MPKQPAAADFRNALTMGNDRFAGELAFDAPVYVPPLPAWAACPECLIGKQVLMLGSKDKLLRQYVELLARAVSLVQFVRSNIGDTGDWPLSVCGDSAAAEMCFHRQVAKLEAAAGCLVDGL